MDEYDEIRRMYNGFVRELVPRLGRGKVDEALEVLNRLVGLVRPSDWTASQVPSEILGMTPERVVVFSGAGRLGFYFGLPYDEIHGLVLRMAEEARTDTKEARCNLKTAERDDVFHKRMAYERAQHFGYLLGDLEALERT